MKALLLEEPKKFKFIERPEIDEKNKVVIKVKAAGICGSDLSSYKGIFPLVTYPRVPGHEIAGEVVYVPENDKGIKIGDKVTLEPYKYCGECYPCSIGRTNCCEDLKVIGVHVDGGMAEYYAHDLHLVHKVPDSISWEHVPMIEPLTISIHGVHRVDVKEGEYVVVTGGGTIGLLAAQFVLTLGAVPIMVDPMDNRLKLAESLGIKYTLNPMTQDVVKEISNITKGRMAEVVVEASGAPSAVKSAIDYVSYAGRVSLVGYPKSDIPLPTFLFTKKELDVRGSRNSAKEFPLAIKLIEEGKVIVEPIITNIIEFEEMPEYFELITQNPNDYLKVIAKL